MKMKTKICPICKDKNIQRADITVSDNVIMKECKNKDRGCNSQLYHFDDEHEMDCIYNLLHRNFCNNDKEFHGMGNLIGHYESHCINAYTILNKKHNNGSQKETCGREYYFEYLKPELTIINLDDEYVIMIIPKLSQKKINFVMFSPNAKYKQSNYKISITNDVGDVVLNSLIHYNKMCDSYISCDQICKSSGLLTFTVKNIFILNREDPIVIEGANNSWYFEPHTEPGEPDSAGNWTPNTFDDILH